jgi:putative ABC transport system permease protein
MKELFGIPMNAIMIAMLVLFALSMLSVTYIALTNRTMFKMGLRNVPRRGLQTILVVVGLMLATLITTTAFTTGDTIDHSITKLGYDHLQRADLVINFQGEDSEQSGESVYIDGERLPAIEQRFADGGNIAGFVPFLFEPVPALNRRTGLSEPGMTLSGVDIERLSAIGGLRLTGGGEADLRSLGETEAFLTVDAADELDAKTGDVVTIWINGSSTDLRVAGIVEDELASTGTQGSFDTGSGGGAVVSIETAQRLSGREGQFNYLTVSLNGGIHTSFAASDAAETRLAEFFETPAGTAALGVDRAVEVDPIKKDSIEEAQKNGNIFTTFFLLLGLFSIAAGIMLIFMIFVMLAAERKAEMGMARAVGAQRSNLVQSFVSEGMTYNLIAGAVGAALGVGASIALVVGFLRYSVGEEFNFLEPHITVRSLVISYCLGVSLTFITVVIASMKVSAVNIVAAIRGTEEDTKRKPRPSVNWKWVAIGVPALLLPPLGIWLLFNKGLGISWSWILAPLGVVLGLLAILMAKGNGSEFMFSFGFCILPLSAAILAAHYRVNGRVLWTIVGGILAGYWLSPVNVGEKLLGREMKGDIEMFLVSGIMVVVAFTLIIVFNARLLTLLFQRSGGAKYRTPAIVAGLAIACAAGGVVIGDRGDGVGQVLFLIAGVVTLAAALSFASVRFPHLAPALKMGVAYPLANRFRTGMTIAMFSLIVFSIVVFSAVNANFSASQTGEDGAGGWDVVATANRNNPVELGEALQYAGSDIVGGIEALGRVTVFTGTQEIDDATQGAAGDWETYPVVAGDATFFSDSRIEARADGYADDAAVRDAIRTTPNLALIDTLEWGPYGYTSNVDVKDGGFEAFEIAVRDTVTGNSANVTVIGVLTSKLKAELAGGVYVNEETYRGVFGEPEFDRTYVRLADGVGATQAARDIEAALSTEGVQAESIRQLIDESAAQDQAFTRMFQGFMALGLMVGIAALGVIAFRSVVERRQQIGMLRAIGYQRGTVALTFVLESGFIAVMGILSGVIGGVIVSRNLFSTGQFSEETVNFMIPWTEVLGFVGAALLISLLMTWWPSRNAANVPVADALRYE